MLQADVKGLYYRRTRDARLLPRHVEVSLEIGTRFPFRLIVRILVEPYIFHSLSTVHIDPRMAFQIPERMLAAQVVEVPYFFIH